MADIFDTLEAEPKDIFDTIESDAGASQPQAEIRPPTFREKLQSFTGSYQRELQREVGAGGVPTPREVMDTAFKFATPPPPVSERIEKYTDIPLKVLPPEVAGGIQGVRDIALQVPFAAGAVGLGKTLGRGLLGLFTGEFLMQTPELYREFQAARAAGDDQKATRILVGGLGTAALLGMGAKIDQNIRAGGRTSAARQKLANDILDLSRNHPEILEAAKPLIQRPAPPSQRVLPKPPAVPVVAPIAKPEEQVVTPQDAVTLPNATAELLKQAGAQPAAVTAEAMAAGRAAPQIAAAGAVERAAAITKPPWVINLEAVEKAGNLNEGQAERLNKWRAENQLAPPAPVPEEPVVAEKPTVAQATEAAGGAIKPFDIRVEGVGQDAAVASDNVRSMNQSGHVYRGMTESEFDNTIGKGVGVESRKDFSFGTEGTSFSERAEDAESYVNFGRDDPRTTGKSTYIVEIKQSPNLIKNRQGYYEAKAAVPMSDVSRVWKVDAQGNKLVARLVMQPALQTPQKPSDVVQPAPQQPAAPAAPSETGGQAYAVTQGPKQEGGQQKYTGAAPGTAVSADQAKVREAEGQPAGGGNRPVGGGPEPQAEPGPTQGEVALKQPSQVNKPEVIRKEQVWVWDRNNYELKRATVEDVETSELDQYKTTKVHTDQGTFLSTDVFSEKPTIKEERDQFGVIKTAEGKQFPAEQWKRRNPNKIPERYGIKPIIIADAHAKTTPTRSEISELANKLYNQHIKDTLGKPQVGLPEFIKMAERQLIEESSAATPAAAGGAGEAVVSFTDKSVRDHPQQATIKGDTITVNLKVGRSKVGSYTIPISEWQATEKWPSANPNWNKAKLVEKYSAKLGLDDQPGGPDQAQRIRDSHVRAIQGALKKQSPPSPAPPEATAGPSGPGLSEGPGATALGAPAASGKSQIEQLGDAFAAKAPSKERAQQLVRESFDFGSRIGAAKDMLGRALNALKASGDSVWTALTKFDKPDQLLMAKGNLSAELETRGWRVRQFANNVRKAIPDKRRRAAIAKWVDAGGDDARLALGEAATKPEFRQSYRDARNLSADDKIAAQNIQNYFDSRLQEAIDADVLEAGLQDYIHRIYQSDPATRQRALAYVQSGILTKNPSLAKKRFYEFDYEAEAMGRRPVQDFLPRLTDYETSLSKAIAARKFIWQLTQMTAADGRPIVGIKGLGLPVEDQAGVRTGTVIKPLGDFRKNSIPGTPDYRGDYKTKEYPSLSRWKWIGQDTDGKPIFMQGPVAIHHDYVSRVEALLEPSHVRYGSNEKLSKIGRGALGASSVFKQTMLDLSGFHQVQIALHAMEHRVMPWSIVKDINFSDPKVEGLLKGGVTLGGDYHDANFGEGLFGKSLTQHVPILGPIAESYHSWLFQSFIPRVKMTMALHALERNRIRYAKDLATGRMTEQDLNYMTAKQANAAFGELNYTMLERNKTIQDIARLSLLAPDFLEARGRFVAQALTKYGAEQRVALMLGAVTMYTLARIMNKIVDDQYHFEPENAFSLVKGNHAYSLRTVQGDVLHLIDQPIRFWLNRLNPLYTRTILEAVTQRDVFGRKRTASEIALDTIKNIQPISTRYGRERSLWESMANSFGLVAKRWNDVDKAFKLAGDWKKANKIQERGEFIYDPDKDPLRTLKLALNDGDEGAAAAEIKKIFDNRVMPKAKLDAYFQRFAKMPFTGSLANDKRFMATLTEDQKATVINARKHRYKIGMAYRDAMGKYIESVRRGPM